ncbi:MAG: hypothetical protein RLZZ244_1955 [Verrucomicrobiota bacterium]|jgi:hypothetical protein
MKDKPLRSLDPLSRRLFVERCARAAFGLSVLPALPSGAASAAPIPPKADPGSGFGSAKHVIFLQLRGGMSHIDTFDPKEGPTKGPGSALSTKAGFQISSFLPKTAAVAQHLCLIRSMTAKVGIHATATYLMRTGYEPRGTVKHPMLGAWAQHYLGPSQENLPSSITINHGAEHGNGFFPATLSPLPIIDPSAGLQYSVPYAGMKTLEERLALVNQIDQSFRQRFPDPNVKAYNDFYDATMRLMKSTDLKAFSLSEEPEALKTSYGNSKFGRGCLLARRLVEHGVRFVEVSDGGWDMHNNLEDAMENTGAQFDQAFAALVSDLHARGLLKNTLVVVASEFGRKPEFSGSGRGHYPKVFSTVLAGAGIKRGFVHGASDAAGAEPVGEGVTVGHFHATLGWAAGLPLKQVVTAPSGRPFTVGNQSAPVSAVFA